MRLSDAHLGIKKLRPKGFEQCRKHRNLYIYEKLSYADSQTILKHLPEMYGSPYQVTAKDLENGFVYYEDFLEQIAKETTCIYLLDVTDSVKSVEDLHEIFRSGNYIILDIVEEKIVGESYYTCQIDWCFTNDVKWGSRVRSEDNPNIKYLSELAGFDD